MATLTDRYVQALIKYNDSLTEQKKKDVQKQYNAWAQKKSMPVDVTPTVETETPVEAPAETPVEDHSSILDMFKNNEQGEIPALKAVGNVAKKVVGSAISNITGKAKQKEEKPKQNYSSNVKMDSDGNADISSLKQAARDTKKGKDAEEKVANAVNAFQELQNKAAEIPGLIYGPNARAKVAQAKLEKQVDKADANTQISYYSQKWLDPSYTMTDEDKAKYKALVKQWRKENPEGAKAWDNNFDGEVYHWDFLNDYPEVRDLLDIEQKNDPFAAFANGLRGSFDLPQLAGAGIGKLLSDDEGDAKIDAALARRENQIANAKSQHKIAAGLGDLYGQTMQYIGLGALGDALGVGSKAAESGSKVIPFLQEQGFQLAGDTVVQTAPLIARDIQQQKDAGTIAKDAAIDLGTNALMNLGIGFAGLGLNRLDARRTARRAAEAQALAESAENAVKNADNSIVEEVAKSADDTKPIVENVAETKPIVEEPKPIIEETRPILDNADETKAVVNNSVADEARRIDNIVDETKNLDNTAKVADDLPTKTMAEDTGLRPDELTFNPEKELTGQSRVVTNSALNADVVTAKEIADDPIIKDIMEYEKHSNSITLTDAMDRFERNGQRWKDDFISGKEKIANDTDVDTAMLILQDLKKKADKLQGTDQYEAVIAERNALLRKLREFGTEKGQAIQAFAKWNNTADGAMLTATGVENDVVRSWAKKNQKAIKGNARIAQALEDMGNVWKETPEKKLLTHEEVVEGVRRELEKEFSGIEGLFNDEDIEFLARLAEDRKIPVWQITDEIEHKLKHGEWYTLDESIAPKMPTNTKLNNALNALVEGEVRQAPKAKPTLQQITDEVRNTVRKESASFDNFTEDDIAYLANLINNGASKQDIVSALNTKLATGRFGISAETQQRVNELFRYAEQFNPNSKEFVEYQAEALRLLADEVVPKATALEKFEAWRYMAMLGNPKTMLRNYIGNKTFGLVTGISNNLAALGEATVDRASKKFGGEGIQRTKSVLNLKNDRGLIDAAKADADISRYRQMAGSKYEKIDKDALRRSKSVFDSKIAQLYEKAVDAGISDYSAIKGKYSTSLAGYLKANGFDKSIFEAEGRLARLRNLAETRVLTPSERDMMTELADQVKALDKGRDFALKQAEYATFHEDNAIASLLTKWSKDARDSDHLAANAMGMVIEGTVPFKKTPANVLRSGLEYSPLGAIDSIRKTGKLIYENTGKRAGNLADTYTVKKLFGKGEQEVNKTLAADVIDSWSKTITGTSMTALGAYLYNKGIIQASDADTKAQDQLEGKQNYSVIINGKSYTIDWAAPAVMPLLLGAEISKVREETAEPVDHWYENIDNYMNAIGTIAEPIVETSYLSGVRNAFEDAADAAQYGGKDVALSLLANAGLGYATQGIPTLFGQVARTVDNTRRSTYTDKEGIARTFERQLNKIENKIPFLSMTNDPYVDSYGRQQKNGPTDNPLLNLGYQMLSPGYLQSVNVTPADELSRRVYEETGKEDTGILPVTQYGLKIDGEKATPEQFTEFSKVYGNANYEIRDALAGSDWFNKLDATEQAEILSSVNNLAKNVGKSVVDENFTSTDKALEAYQNGGTEGLIQYYRGKNALGTIGAGPTSRAGEYVMNAEDPMKAAKEISKATDMMKSTGLLDKKADYPTADLMDKYEELGYKGLKDYGNAVKEARKAGVMGENSTTMPESVQEFYDNYGVDGVKDYASAMDTLRKNGLLKEDAKSLPKEVREIYAQSGMKGVNDYVTIETNQKGASYSGYQKIQGQIPYLTATEYNNIYNQFSVPSENGNYNATFSKDAELIPYLTSRTWSNDNELNIYAHALAPSVEGTWHIKNNQLYYNKPSVEKWNG